MKWQTSNEALCRNDSIEAPPKTDIHCHIFERQQSPSIWGNYQKCGCLLWLNARLLYMFCWFLCWIRILSVHCENCSVKQPGEVTVNQFRRVRAYNSDKLVVWLTRLVLNGVDSSYRGNTCPRSISYWLDTEKLFLSRREEKKLIFLPLIILWENFKVCAIPNKKERLYQAS